MSYNEVNVQECVPVLYVAVIKLYLYSNTQQLSASVAANFHNELPLSTEFMSHKGFLG